MNAARVSDTGALRSRHMKTISRTMRDMAWIDIALRTIVSAAALSEGVYFVGEEFS